MATEDFMPRVIDRDEEQLVYFLLRCDGCIKIGTSCRVLDRQRELERDYGSALLLLAVESGGFRKESALHRQFKELRHDGEWFLPDHQLCTHVASLDTSRCSTANEVYELVEDAFLLSPEWQERLSEVPA